MLAMIAVQVRTIPPVRVNNLPYTSSAKARSRSALQVRISRLAIALVEMRDSCVVSRERMTFARLPKQASTFEIQIVGYCTTERHDRFHRNYFNICSLLYGSIQCFRHDRRKSYQFFGKGCRRPSSPSISVFNARSTCGTPLGEPRFFRTPAGLQRTLAWPGLPPILQFC